MKIQYASDLHLEFPGNRAFLSENPLKPNAKVLILAGDICYLKHHFDLAFFDYCSAHWENTFIIPGNHEFYKSHFDIRDAVLDFELEVRHNVSYINNRSIEIGNTRIIFSTLWTEIKACHYLEQRLNDFHLSKFEGNRFRVDHYNWCHQQSLLFLNKELSTETGSAQTIMVTHHVPFPGNYCDYPFISDLSEAFHVDMTDLVKRHSISYWIYGHNHFNKAPMEINGTLFLTNQLGYVDREEHKLFNHAKCLSVGI